MTREAPERCGQRAFPDLNGKCPQRGRGRLIHLFNMMFFQPDVRRAGLHAHPYSSKFPPLPAEFAQQIRRPLPDERGRGAACRDELQLLRPGIGDADVRCERGGQCPVQLLLQARFASTSALQVGECRLGAEDLLQDAHDVSILHHAGCRIEARPAQEKAI